MQHVSHRRSDEIHELKAEIERLRGALMETDVNFASVEELVSQLRRRLKEHLDKDFDAP